MKNIGRALLARAGDPYAAEWEIDRTSRAARVRHGPEAGLAKRRAVETEVTRYTQANFSFAVSKVRQGRAHRAGVAHDLHPIYLPSVPAVGQVLGAASPNERIRFTGLWLVNELFKEPLTEADLGRLEAALL